MLPETEIILNEIKKLKKLYNSKENTIIIKVNQEKETLKQTYDIIGVFNNEVDNIEATHNITTLNEVMKELLNNDYLITFEFEQYWKPFFIFLFFIIMPPEPTNI